MHRHTPPRSNKLHTAEGALPGKLGKSIDAHNFMRGLRGVVKLALEGAWQNADQEWQQVEPEEAVEVAREFARGENVPPRVMQAVEHYVILLGREHIRRALVEEAIARKAHARRTADEQAALDTALAEEAGQPKRRKPGRPKGKLPAFGRNRGDDIGQYLGGDAPDRIYLDELSRLL